MSSPSVVGIGAGIGTLFFSVACFVVFQIYKRKRQHNREIAEIEQGFPPAHPMEIAPFKGPGTCQLPFVPSYAPCGRWDALASTETIHRLPAFAQVNNRVHPAFVFPEEQSRMGWSFPGRNPRLSRMPSNARRLQALSAIIESPKGTPIGGPKLLPGAAKGCAVKEQEMTSASMEQLIVKPAYTATESPQIPPRSTSRPTLLANLPPPLETLTREPSRPRTTRSKSLGTVSNPNKPNTTVTFAATPGPAPTGPLPPLPPLPRNISRQSGYNPANRHSALGIPQSKHNESTSTSLNSSPERNWERVISTETVNLIPEYNSIKQNLISDASGGAEPLSSTTRVQSSSSLGHRRSLVCLSITSNGSNRNSCSSLASTLEKQSHRLSIPQILNVDRISISRVSSSGSLSSGNGGLTVVSTPRRRTASRVSASGSPSEKPKSDVLRSVSGNAGSPQRPMKSSFRASGADALSKWEKSTMGPKHSILKGSPGARKGHRRQNCVRLSTLAPTVLGPAPKPRSTSPSLMDGIREESPDGKCGPIAEKHLNGDVTLRPRTSLDPLRLRASLTPSSPTLSMTAYQHGPWGSEVDSRRAVYASHGARSPLSREASLFSIPSLPSVSYFDQEVSNRRGSSTPVIEFTRPSAEWSEHERTPPFALRVTPKSSKQSPIHIEPSPPLPSWSRKYDPSWPMLEMNPPASGQEYDPSRPISVYSSGEEDGSSPNFPFAVCDESKFDTWSSPPSFLQDYGNDDDKNISPTEDNKENDSPCVCAAALPERIRSPFDSMPILRPHASLLEDLDASLPSPPPSPNFSICKTPPLLSRALSNASSVLSNIRAPDSKGSSRHHRRRSSSTSPRRRSGGIEKSSSRRKRVIGPRAQPPKDVRKSIMALRRMNSSLQVSEDEMSKGSQRYLRLGREASLELPFDFGFSSDTSDNEDDPPKDILLEREDEDAEEGGSRECKYVTYSPTRPVLRLLTTLPEAVRAPLTHLTVWDAGEGYWPGVSEAGATASPVDTRTPTNALDKMMGWAEKDTQLSSPLMTTKEESLQVLQEGEEAIFWDEQKSKAMETPKSVRSLYDHQGFFRTP